MNTFKNKNTIILVVAIILAIAFVCLGLILNKKPDPINPDLQRLDEISKELSNNLSLQKETQIQIDNLNSILTDLQTQEANLNDEANNIFSKMMSPTISQPCNDSASLTWDDTDTDRQPGMLNESGDAQVMPPVTGDDSHARFKSLATSYGLNPSTIREVENHYGIKEWVILCITVAETSGWNRWAGWKNIGSVWSNDRWDRPTYALMEAGLEAIWKTLNNWYLWKTKTLWCLSNAGHCQENISYRYATSDWNRERNMIGCLSEIYWKIDPATFNIRR